MWESSSRCPNGCFSVYLLNSHPARQLKNVPVWWALLFFLFPVLEELQDILQGSLFVSWESLQQNEKGYLNSSIFERNETSYDVSADLEWAKKRSFSAERCSQRWTQKMLCYFYTKTSLRQPVFRNGKAPKAPSSASSIPALSSLYIELLCRLRPFQETETERARWGG